MTVQEIDKNRMNECNMRTARALTGAVVAIAAAFGDAAPSSAIDDENGVLFVVVVANQPQTMIV